MGYVGIAEDIAEHHDVIAGVGHGAHAERDSCQCIRQDQVPVVGHETLIESPEFVFLQAALFTKSGDERQVLCAEYLQHHVALLLYIGQCFGVFVDGYHISLGVHGDLRCVGAYVHVMARAVAAGYAVYREVEAIPGFFADGAECGWLHG